MWEDMVFLLSLLILILSIPIPEVAGWNPPIAQPGCNDTCGNVSIPFPFGIGHGCFLDPWFEIECKRSSDSDSIPIPVLSKLHGVELKTTYFGDTAQSSMTILMPPVNACTDANSIRGPHGLDLTGGPFSFSSDDNVFVMAGCPGSAILTTDNMTIMAGCATTCNTSNTFVPFNACYGVRCCQTPLRDYFQSYRVGFNRQPSIDHAQSCLVATLIDSGSLDDYALRPSSTVPVVLTWLLSNDVRRASPNAKCSPDGSGGLSCICDESSNYYGNPYVEGGCQVPQACKGCRGGCFQNYGSLGPIANSYYCIKKPFFTPGAIIGISVGTGMVPLLAILFWLFRFMKRRREARKRRVFFKRNGGMLLQQQISSNDGAIERTKVFSASELDRATDHFNENRILGQGGQGTVYKGMLTDGRIVAIKKSKLLDVDQLEQFINEVVVLSQINHRNVVKLLGCCLETEVPLLIYEFISNGTLSEHIHNPDEDYAIDWALRLKVAADSAGAVAYLHSSSSVPIYHRDIKSSNILLDDKSRAKVSDFGLSKTIAIDQTHLTTLVQGTMGYLDPEYLRSYQFTEKSDVYSFGVVLLELLTGKKPIYRCKNMEQKNLVTEFNLLMKHSRLSEILDPTIAKEAREEVLMTVVELAIRCLDWNGKLRPTMKEVAMSLEMIIKSSTQHGCSSTSCENATVGTSDADLTLGGTLPIETSSFSHIEGAFGKKNGQHSASLDSTTEYWTAQENHV